MEYMNKSYLTSKIPPERYPILIRGTLLITAGSLIAIIETFISIYLGIHNVTYIQAAYIALFVLSMDSILIAIPYFMKNLLVWHEWMFFGIYLVLFQIGICFWIYRLGDLRLLALINALTSITILLSYTNVIQSFLITIFTLFCYCTVSWYAIKIAGQPGSLTKEIFFSFCLFPAFMIVSASAFYISEKRKNLQNIKLDLEKINDNLTTANNELKREQMLTEIEMSLAKEIQNAIFPAKAPVVSDWDIAFMTKPYGAVSGDFYDFYCTDNTLNGLSLFDVSGHGVAPALITILAKPVFYNNFKRSDSSTLGNVLAQANSELCDELNEVNLYITGLMLKMEGNEVEYANAGHPDLLHLEYSSKKISAITDHSGLYKGRPIGITSSKDNYSSLKFNVQTGDFLILYSDGLTESKNESGEQYGITRLSNAIASSERIDSAGLLEQIKKSLNDFTGDSKATDDITIIIAGKS